MKSCLTRDISNTSNMCQVHILERRIVKLTHGSWILENWEALAHDLKSTITKQTNNNYNDLICNI